MPLRYLCAVVCLLWTSATFAQNVPHSSHVWVLNEENNSFEDIVGNPQMPYYNQLIQQYGLATQFYSDQHSSLPALMWFVAGAAVEPNNDTTSCEHDEDNIVREVLKQGYSWRAYEENLPTAGYQGLYAGTTNLYYRRHNPLIDFSDVCPGTGQDTNSVPYTQMAADFANGNTVNYAWITPAGDDDDHDGTLHEADQWLQAHLPAILARPEFGPGGDGILFIVWDESELDGDNRCSATVSQGCGGRTAAIVIGPQVKAGYQSTVLYHNENVLKTVCVAMGLPTCPGAAQDAAPMSDFFATGNASDGIVISTPGSGATVIGPVQVQATATESQPVNHTEVWDNGAKLGNFGTQINATFNLAVGQHTTTVLDVGDSSGVMHRAAVTYTVQPVVDGVEIISPTANETISMSTVHVVAQATESVPVSQMQVWDNGTKLGWYPGTQVNQYFTLATGDHNLTVTDLNNNNEVIHKTSVSYSVQVDGVVISTPAIGATVTGPVHLVASASESQTISQTQVWDNGVKLGVYGDQIDATYNLGPGTHTTTVEDLNSGWKPIHQTSVTFTVLPQ
ncbi:MAG TPA: alkaline phosphatase family protein [Acidobacteriaceae bacterium]|nr:alkaline phosphatase family protein [Acidobacteriaceae bacterium]